MALAGIAAPDRQPSPANLALSSNNPFRNRTAASSAPNATSPPPNNPRFVTMAKNPFLDASEASTSPVKDEKTVGLTEDIFKDLSLLDKSASTTSPPVKNVPPPRTGALPTSAPGVSDPRARPSRPPRAPDSPSKKEHLRRPRGMSESSLMDKERDDRHDREPGERPPRSESEERRRRERRKEREERHRREKEKLRKGEKPMKKPQGLDIIDKLDVTGIYGQGLFHHDGPFDACNPHRNARKDRRAPMHAFPADSANMQLGGAGPLRSQLDLDKFHGRGEESFTEYGATRKPATSFVNPTDRTEQVHGDETYGLGTSTFLEGAPASKSALQRRDSDEQVAPQDPGMALGGGLSRKRSLAQRLRGMSATRQRPGDLRSPDAKYNINNDRLDPSAPHAAGTKAVSAGGSLRARYAKENEIDPFDNDYEAAFDKKGSEIRVAEQEKPSGATRGRPRAPSSPKGPALVRSVTADSAVPKSSNEEERSNGGGFLSRMKSLKGGRRARPETKDT